MSPLEIVAVLLAGVGAGTINAVVGSGTIITFSTLVAFGVPPVVANISNSLGVVPGSVTGAFGYRRELAGQRGRIRRLLVPAVLGGITGAALLILLPAGAFETIVPALILLGVVLVIVGPRLSKAVAARAERRGVERKGDAAWVWPAVFGGAIYGGYFGAAQGVIVMALLGIGVAEPLQRLNGIKNVIVAAANLVAGVVFVLVSWVGWSDAEVDWLIVLLIGVGAFAGGLIGASVGRRLPPNVLRGFIVVVGLSAVALMVLT
ncbi:sulfite exporter TauE/SafE family protein [Nocardioides immobilis]|uniref:Probable membrane transporter protein n=1 Tax=Nocardioides immobilis TaxID=2049295 RepID=A0A417XYZ4_9ACTN|nr:sulfite exporter TauE/SafE family protein [Nocardioides immobilis]RHW25584.1 sulfite exporter TauE/SafE family protein [Nocardioides immobilis]